MRVKRWMARVYLSRPGRAGQPDRRVADGRAHFEDPLGAGNLDQQSKHARHRGADDGNAPAARIGFHLGDDGVALRQQAVKVFFNVLAYKPVRHGTPLQPRLSPGLRTWIWRPAMSRVS